MGRSTLYTCGLASVIGLAASLGLSAAHAAARPALKLSLPSQADAGKPIPYGYSTFGMKKSSKLVVQRRQGTARTWRTTRTLPSRKAGSGALPALPLGKYQLRIAEIAADHKVRVAQQAQLLVFGDVPVGRLFAGGESGGAWYFDSPSSGVYTLPTSVFPYALGMFANQDNDFTFATVSGNPCRTLHLDFVPGIDGSTDPRYDSSSASVSVLQQSLDPQAATASYNQLGALDAKLDLGKSWSLVTRAFTASIKLYANGSASCYLPGPLHKPAQT